MFQFSIFFLLLVLLFWENYLLKQVVQVVHYFISGICITIFKYSVHSKYNIRLSIYVYALVIPSLLTVAASHENIECCCLRQGSGRSGLLQWVQRALLPDVWVHSSETGFYLLPDYESFFPAICSLIEDAFSFPSERTMTSPHPQERGLCQLYFGKDMEKQQHQFIISKYNSII